MATLLSSIRSQARTTLLETSASFWSEAELAAHIVNGIKDLWGAIADLHQEHYATDDATNVTLSASSNSLSGVPSDVFRVLLIEPRSLSSSDSGRAVRFVPRDYNSPEFENARAMSAQEASGGLVIYYAVWGAGAPVGAPTIKVAPQISTAMNLRLVYIPTLADSLFNDFDTDNNPVPGESDMALIAYCIAFARAKERDDRSPDPNWLAVYATEKQNILTRLTPRQEQEPEYVTGMFEEFY